MNKRLVRLADFTGETERPDVSDPAWRTWTHGGPVAEALGNRRLLAVAIRDPAPPLFGPGFGVRESAPAVPSFRWAGPAAHLYVPADQGPLCAVLSGERPSEAGDTTLRVTEAGSGRLILTRHVAPGPFDLAIVPRAVVGPMPGPAEYVLACDRPKDLPPLEGATRPARGCFTFREAIGDTGLDLRWTTGDASIVFSPVPGFAPARLVLRARAAAAFVDVTVSV